MTDINLGRIHELKKRSRILSAELDKMQSDPSNEANHFEEACNIARWVIKELSALFPAVHDNAKYGFHFESGVLIDDHPIFADIWNDSGLIFGKHVTHYINEEKFISDLHRYDKLTFLYVDWYLRLFRTSFEFTKMLATVHNFRNIIITTEETGLNISSMPWIKAIITKDPPWNLGRKGIIV